MSEPITAPPKSEIPDEVIAVVEANGKVFAALAVEVMMSEMVRVDVAVIAPPKKEEPEV